jgi:Zn-finger nucleic acid-binding protein
MHVWESRGVVLDHCHRCKGLWFDAGELGAHLAASGARIEESDLEPEEETGFPCPRCDGVHLAHVRVETVTLDRCPRCHGLFVDVGEVHELIGALRRGEYANHPALSHLSNLALGLYIGARLGQAEGATDDGGH